MFYAAFNTKVQKGYAAYAKACYTRSWPFVLAGFLLIALLSIGLINFDQTSNYYDLWQYRGERLDDERLIFDEHFGGVTRVENILMSSRDGGNSATPEVMTASLAAVSSVYEEDTDVAVTVDGQVYDINDVCERPSVPAVFQPFDNSASPIGWFDGGNFMSYGYKQVADCVASSGGASVSPLGVIPEPSTPLPDGWGIGAFPCKRLSHLDCFSEGKTGYPASLQELDEWVDFVFFNENRDDCLAAFEAESAATAEAVFTAMGDAEEVAAAKGAATGATLAQRLTSVTGLFWTWGYRWRQSFADMDEADLLAHFTSAVDNANPNTGEGTLPASSCVARGAPCCLTWSGTQIASELIMADIEQDGTEDSATSNAEIGPVESISYFMTIMNNFNIDAPLFANSMEQNGITSLEGREEVVIGWERAYIAKMSEAHDRAAGSMFAEGEEHGDTTLNFFAFESAFDMIEDAQSLELKLFVSAVVVMIFVSIITLTSFSCAHPKAASVYSRSLLGVGGFLVTCGAIIASFGAIGALDILATPVSMNIVPFLALGLGIDDFFVLAYALESEAEFSDRPDVRIQLAMAKAGPSVCITSVCNALAFLCSAAVPINVVRTFAYHMCITIMLILVLLHLIFVPLMCWDCRRVAERRIQYAPCKQVPQEELISEKEFTESGFDAKRFVRSTMAPTLANPIVKAAVCIISFGGAAFFAWYGFDHMRRGLHLSTFALKDSYQQDFLEIKEADYTASSAFVVTEESDFPNYQQTMLNVQERIAANTGSVSDELTVRDLSWLTDSSSAFLPSVNASTPLTPVPAAAFYPAWLEWVTGSGVTYAADQSCRTNGEWTDCAQATEETVLVATKESLIMINQASVNNIVNGITSSRKAIDNADGNEGSSYFYSGDSILFSQYQYTWETMGTILGLALAAIIFTITLLEGSFLLAVVLCVVIILCVIVSFGIMPMLDVPVSGFSIVNLAVSVGLIVEFTSHIGRAYLFAAGDGQQRIATCLEELLFPTAAGAFTTFISMLPLQFSKIEFFHNTYFQTYAIFVMVGFFGGVILLPVLLSIVNPKTSPGADIILHSGKVEEVKEGTPGAYGPEDGETKVQQVI